MVPDKDNSTGKITINLGIVSFELPASMTLIIAVLIIVVTCLGVWQWPRIGNWFGWGFSHAVPRLLEPHNAAMLTAYPRQINLKWEALSGAARYVIEVQAQDPETGEWFPHPGQSRWTTSVPSQAIEFIGDQPGRWNVVAIDEDNSRSQQSLWHEFFYMTSVTESEAAIPANGEDIDIDIDIYPPSPSEDPRVETPVATPAPDDKQTSTFGNMFSHFHVRDMPNRIDVTINYTFLSDHGDVAKVAARPLKDGRFPSNFFSHSTEIIQKGKGKVTLVITFYPTEDEQTLTTDHVELIMWNESGTFFRVPFQHSKIWKKQ